MLETWFEKKEQLEKLRCKIKYASLFAVPSQGKSDGLALLWKLDNAIWVDSFSKNHIDAIVNGGSIEAWRFISFYGELD